MNRPYTQGFSNKVNFFSGEEIERTPAFGLRTLFVVGNQKTKDILRFLGEDISHIYFGANHSFRFSKKAKEQIRYFINLGFICSLDMTYEKWIKFDLSGLDATKFIPIVSVRLPNVERYGNNLTIKVDDSDFAATNKGVWLTTLPNMAFNDWSGYSKDEVL